jgi:acyl carrier protein
MHPVWGRGPGPMTPADDVIRDFIRREFLRDSTDIELDDDLPLIREGILDSLGIFTVIGFIEETFRIKVEPDDVMIENFQTVRSVAELVRTRLKVNEPPGS